MSNDLILKTISEKFPFYNESERSLIQSLVIGSKERNSEFFRVKEEFMEILYYDLVQFYRWDNELKDRIRLRRRFLCVSGLFAVISIEELRGLAAKARLTLKKVVYETPSKPSYELEAEWHSYDLKYLPQFEPVLSKIPFADGITVMDYLAGSREKRLYPPTSFTVLMNNLTKEVLSEEFITATAEPLTQTQLISLTDDKNQPRDVISIGYDMVFESAFIDFYYHGKNLTPILLLRNAHVMGLFFLKSAMLIARNYFDPEIGFSGDFPVFSFAPAMNTQEKATALLDHYVNQFIPSIEKKITEWNLSLDLDPDYDMVYWPGE